MVYVGRAFAGHHSHRPLDCAGTVFVTAVVAASAVKLSGHRRVFSRWPSGGCAFERQIGGRKHERPDARFCESQTVVGRRVSVELFDLLVDRWRLAGMGLQPRIAGSKAASGAAWIEDDATGAATDRSALAQ